MTFNLVVIYDASPGHINLVIIEHPDILRKAVIGSQKDIKFSHRGLLIKQLSCFNYVSILKQASHIDEIHTRTVFIENIDP